jgi:hypothetical protein
MLLVRPRHFVSLLRFAVISVPLGCTMSEENKPADAAEVAVPARPTTWHDVDIARAVGGPRALFAPMAYVRQDGTAAVLWQGSLAPGEDAVFESADSADGWRRTDLSAAANSKSKPWAGAFGYARTDGNDSVVYVAEVGKQRHVKELTWSSAQKRWQDWDLTAATKGPPIDSTPVAYLRGDRTSSVVYCQFNGDIREMWLPSPEWHEASLRQAAGGAEPANCDLCRPSPVATGNGQSMVIYLGLDNHVHALVLASSSWSHHDLSRESRSKFDVHPCPTAYLRSDGTVSVLYKVPVTGGFKLREMTGNYQAAGRNWTWADWDFFQATTPPPPLIPDCSGVLCNPGDAYGFVTPKDNVTHVVYPSQDSRIEEITLKGGRWARTVPSPSEAGGAACSLLPRPYVRRDGSPAVVYLDPSWSVHELRLY